MKNKTQSRVKLLNSRDGIGNCDLMKEHSFLQSSVYTEQNTRYKNSGILRPQNDPVQPIFMAVFTITDTGPGVVWQDITELPHLDIDKDMLNALLGKMSIGYITALGMGHEYHEGVFDLPASNLSGYRLVLISVKLFNPKASDPRLHIGLYQFALFMPVQLTTLLPAYSSLETAIINIVKAEVRFGDRLVDEILYPLKTRLLRFLDTQVSKISAQRLFNEIK